MRFATVCAALFGASAVLAAPAPLQGCTLPAGLQQPLDTADVNNRLPAPTGKLVKLMIGVGTQNYTCQSGAYVAQGAKAWLYDASCFAKDNIQLVHSFPDFAIQLDPSKQDAAVKLATSFNNQNFLSGVHYFTPDFATPNFFFNDRQKSKFIGELDVKIPAPSYSSPGYKGTAASVPWLKLKSKPGSDYSAVYRLVTAGGAAPKTCTSGKLEVPYVAQYWFYQ